MENLKIRILSLLVVVALGLPAVGQNACEKYFSNGVKFQQTMTVASQNKAINMFKKAKTCYSSKAKKNLCDQQITACRNIIAQLSKSKEELTPVPDKEEKKELPEIKLPEPELTVAETYLKFKDKGDYPRAVKVACNRLDWKVNGDAEWLKCTKNGDDEIVIEVDKNDTKKERSGNVTVECDGKSVNIVVVQEKKGKKLGIF